MVTDLPSPTGHARPVIDGSTYLPGNSVILDNVRITVIFELFSDRHRVLSMKNEIKLV